MTYIFFWNLANHLVPFGVGLQEHPVYVRTRQRQTIA